MALLFATVVSFTFMFVFGSWNFLLSGIYEGFKSGEHSFNFRECLEALGFLMLFNWCGQTWSIGVPDFLILFRTLV